MIRLILAAATLSLTVTAADAALVCHDTRHRVIKCVHRPVFHHRVVVKRTYVHHNRGVLRCHDARGKWIVCKR